MLGEMPVWYLFLGGSGAGLLLVVGVTMLFVPSRDRMISHGIAGDVHGVDGIYRCLARLFVPACSLSWASYALPLIWVQPIARCYCSSARGLHSSRRARGCFPLPCWWTSRS